MNIFQKISIYLIRLLSFLCMLIGISGFVYSLILLFWQDSKLDGITSGYSLMSGVFYFVWGILLFFVSTPLGRFIGKGLDD